MDAAELHRDAIIIDATCPLARIHTYVDWYREGGATAIAPTITGATGNARTGFAQIGGWHRYVRERNDTIIVRQAADIVNAKAKGKLGLILHCQGTALIEDDIDLLESYAIIHIRKKIRIVWCKAMFIRMAWLSRRDINDINEIIEAETSLMVHFPARSSATRQKGA